MWAANRAAIKDRPYGRQTHHRLRRVDTPATPHCGAVGNELLKNTRTGGATAIMLPRKPIGFIVARMHVRPHRDTWG